jgi:hypothetical protein
MFMNNWLTGGISTKCSVENHDIRYLFMLENLPLVLMSPLMILFVAYTSKDTSAIFAFIGFLACVSPQMDHKVSLLWEGAITVLVRALEQLKSWVDRLQMQV